MDFLIFILSLSVFLLGLALFTNQARSHRDTPFELKPNCLLTRWPLLFVTGPRSIFYFKSYWNLYTLYLAEHGYEVFTLHLPWNNSTQRTEHFLKFLKQQEEHRRHFHLIVDHVTLQELEAVLRQQKSFALASVTELVDETSTASGRLSALPVPTSEVKCLTSPTMKLSFIELAYALHRRLIRRPSSPSLATLGGDPATALANSGLILERAQTLAEMDLRESPDKI